MVTQAISDVDMESGSSDNGHFRLQTPEYAVQPAVSDDATPEASQVGTPLAETPPSTADLETVPEIPVIPLDPSTPSKQGKAPQMAGVGSPSTPRASASNAPDETATPRGEPAAITTPKASIRQSGKRFDSMPARSPTPLVPEPVPAAKIADTKPSGLPQPPPPKRDRYKKGMSLDKFGLAKLLGQAQPVSEASRPGPPSSGGLAAGIQAAQNNAVQRTKRGSMGRPGTADSDSFLDKKSRRRTLQQIVNRCVQATTGRI